MNQSPWSWLTSALGRYSEVARNISWLGAANLIVKPLWFIFITVLCVRILGGAGYGQMTTALSLSSICFALANFGTDEYTVREVSRRPESASLFFTNFVVLRFVLFGLGTIVALAAGAALNYTRELLIAVGVACIYQAMNFLMLHSRQYFRAYARLKYEGGSVVLEKLSVILGGSVLLLLTKDVYFTVAGMAAGMVVAAVFTTYWAASSFASFELRLLSVGFVRQALRNSVPFGLAAVFTLFYIRADLVMIESMIGDLYAGQYGLAYRMMDALNVLPVIVIEAAVFPQIANLRQNGRMADFVHLVRSSFGGLLIVSLIIALTVFLLAPTIIRLIAPAEEVAPAGPALQILCWAFPLACMRIVVFFALLALEQQRFIATALGFAMAVNIGLNFWLIPIVGITGACIATLIAEAVLLCIYLIRYVTDEAAIRKAAMSVSPQVDDSVQ